jgi:hypothetical protein
MHKCPVCGSDHWTIVENLRVMVRKRCNDCGHEKMILISPGGEPAPPVDSVPVFKVLARWTSPPTLEQINRLRDGLPLLGHSEDELLESARAQRQFDLGRFTESELQADAGLLEALELELERIPVSRRPSDLSS